MINLNSIQLSVGIKIFQIIAGITITCHTYSQNTLTDRHFHIRGRIENFGNGMLIGEITTAHNEIHLDTIFIKNDTFSHSAQVDMKQIVRYIAGSNKFTNYRKVLKDGDSVMVDFTDKRLKSIEIVAFPDAELRISGDASTYLAAYPAGSRENKLLACFNRQKYPVLRKLGGLDYTDKKNIRTTLRRENILTDSLEAIENRFVSQNPTSIISSYVLLEKFAEPSGANAKQPDSLFQLLTPQEDDIYYPKIVLLQNTRLQISGLKVGDTFPDFDTKFVYKGTRFDLKDTNGKYRLIDFWGSWCIPCVREMPAIEAFYEKNKSDVAVIGVAMDTYQNWMAFLDKNAYSWIQLLDEQIPKLTDKIHVNVYPTMYLLDPHGKILLITSGAEKGTLNKIENIIKGVAVKQ